MRSHEAYQVGLNQPCVDVVILRNRFRLQDDLDEASGEVLHENDLLESGLQDGLEMAFSCSYISTMRGQLTRSARGLV